MLIKSINKAPGNIQRPQEVQSLGEHSMEENMQKPKNFEKTRKIQYSRSLGRQTCKKVKKPRESRKKQLSKKTIFRIKNAKRK